MRQVQNEILLMKLNSLVSIRKRVKLGTPSRDGVIMKNTPSTNTHLPKDRQRACPIYGHTLPTCNVLGISTVISIRPNPKIWKLQDRNFLYCMLFLSLYKQWVCSGLACFHSMQAIPNKSPIRQGGHLVQGLMQILGKYRPHLAKSARWVTCTQSLICASQILQASDSTMVITIKAFPASLFFPQRKRYPTDTMKICMSFCKYQPHPKHILSPLSTMLSTKKIDFHIREHSLTCPALSTWCQNGPLPMCKNMPQQIRMAVMQDGQNLRILCTMAIGYFKGFLLFSLRKLQATRKPPTLKNTSTAKKAAVTNKQKKSVTFLGMLSALTSFCSLIEN